ncbi:hypothetical protein XppCFBP6982P_23775 [Xanthomonas phaseoli pv. phaseoli]|uniref:Uncharacterized protein n=1 Tax=Xanthomonas campestris pv. phaseoli TaxID=317013 RepID=A0AB34QDM6_XANCH|nr:hypothetical protein AC609_05400 [Xanthomonas phaseoli pv. phaseoli]AZU29294.1 hypothetical protein AC801_05315 [Xanthomonas sp. ISO98C4]AZU24925.1 hypothetical protein AC611_05405 [Xanthomonas phaseoli pv. phaseoli]AZU33692.1 hypothetical protein AC610_05400 [Xanthomonas phaseoli pv. phaseoli]KHD60781.2 hypothetical protein PK68_18420 [Xanthomonas phaseoli pv. phaseoli]
MAVLSASRAVLCAIYKKLQEAATSLASAPVQGPQRRRLASLIRRTGPESDQPVEGERRDSSIRVDFFDAITRQCHDLAISGCHRKC